MKLARYTLCLLFFCACSFGAIAQFNVSVNYNLGYAPAENYNLIIDNYNETQTTEKVGLDNLHVLNGIGMGARYRVGFAGLEFTWTERFKRSSATGTDLEGAYTYRRLGYRYRTFGIGYTTFIDDTWSFGGSFNQDRFKITTETDSDLINGLVEESAYSSRFFIGISGKVGDFLSISLQPFVWVPWGDFDFKNLNDVINPNIPLEDTKENFSHIGISLIFYNGQHY